MVPKVRERRIRNKYKGLVTIRLRGDQLHCRIPMLSRAHPWRSIRLGLGRSSNHFYHNMANHTCLARLLSANAQWAKDVSYAEPQFFNEAAKGQSPKVRSSFCELFGMSGSRLL